jgi:hypothetical protein
MTTMTASRDEPTLDALRHHLKEHAKRDREHKAHVRALVEAATQQSTSAGDAMPSSPADGEIL